MSAEPVEPMPQDIALARLFQEWQRRPLRVVDIEDLDPAIGRVELIDGNPIVTPSPDLEHQDICRLLANALIAASPAGLHAYEDPNVYHPRGELTYLSPDVVVADPSLAVRNGLGFHLDEIVLAVEVTSSNRATDLGLKRDLFARFGVPYVVVDRQDTPHTHHVFGDAPDWLAAALDSYRV